MNDTQYTTICNYCGSKTWYTKEQPCKRIIYEGCKTCGSHENINKPKKCPGTLKIIDNSDLNPRATYFYKSGERVEITYKDGSKTRCYIGKSTGWKPVYLEILKRSSSGGSSLYLPDDAIIRGLGTFKH